MTKSIEKYDNTLRENKHFQIHGEMLPFIGPMYDENKILIISESHFVPENERPPTDDEWYNPDRVKEFLQKMDGNSQTRSVIENDNKPHRLFINLKTALNQTDLKLNLEHVAWYNYFQKPAKFGDSIVPTVLDIEISKNIFETILGIIKPNLVVFASVKAFEALYKKKLFIFDTSRQILLYQSFTPIIEYIPHPNSRSWNTASSKYAERNSKQKRTGKQKFIDVINQYCTKNAK